MKFELELSKNEVNILLDLISGYDTSSYTTELEIIEQKLRDL